MNKKDIANKMKDIVVLFIAIFFVRVILCYLGKTEIFTPYFGLFLLVVFVTSIISKFIIKGNK